MIEVQNLTKRYGDTVAVNNISFDIKKGEIVGLLGPNGAGKTTTMRILTCYLPADSGKATVGGKDVAEQSLEVKRRLGYLPENNPLYADMGVVEYLRFIARIRHISRRQINSKINEMIDMCGLKTVFHKDIGELSKGFCQRVGLAQAMIHNPDILILDEPTVGLDPNQIVEIRELIKRIGQEKTVILSSHILPEVAATCQRIIIMNKGTIADSGTPEEMSRRTSGETIITMVIRGPLEEIKEKLRSLNKVRDFELKELKETDRHCFKITSSDENDIGEELFQMTADNGWTLSELHKEKLSLENIFQQLTITEN